MSDAIFVGSVGPAVPGARMTRFYYQPAMPSKGDSFVVLAGARWTTFLRRHIGIVVPAFFERVCLPHEPDSFENMQPCAWRYASADLLIKDERRWLTADILQTFTLAAHQAKRDADILRAIQQEDAALVAELSSQN